MKDLERLAKAVYDAYPRPSYAIRSDNLVAPQFVPWNDVGEDTQEICSKVARDVLTELASMRPQMAVMIKHILEEE